MRASILIRPPTRPSASARVLREQLPEVARLSRTTAIPSQYKHIINWGNPTDVRVGTGQTIHNKPEAVRLAIDKLASFQKMKDSGVSVPAFSQQPPATKKGDIWFARTKLRSSGGDGIQVVRHNEPFPTAPLYVKYVPKKEEYRVHVVNGEAIFCQQKKREKDTEQTKDQKLIRNYDNGWVFCLVHGEPPAGVKDAAVSAIAALGLDFGAVDIVVDKSSGTAFVLECNTAPGLSSPTLIEAYQKAFTKWLVE